MKIQINDQGREFVNKVSKVLQNMTGTEQRINSAYHLQSNGLCERQNKTIKDSLVKVLDGNPCDWPNIIEGVLLAHRVSKHTSINFSAFFLMYNREATLQIDVTHSLVGIEGNESEYPFDKETFDAVLTTAISMKANIHQTAGENICSAQEKQRRYYNRHYQVPNKIKVGQKVFLKNQRKMDRKCGKFSFKWFGPFTVHSISNEKFCSLINKDGTLIKAKYNVSLLKPYLESDETKVTCDENPPPSATDEQPHDTEKVDPPSSTDKQVLIEERIDNYAITNLPNEVIEMVLVDAVYSSKNSTETYVILSQTCSRFNDILKRRKDALLPHMHMKFPESVFDSLPRFQDKIKVSVRKIMKPWSE